MVHIFGRELDVIQDFESRRPAPGVIAAQHTGVDEQDLATEAIADACPFLNRMSRNDMIRTSMLGIGDCI